MSKMKLEYIKCAVCNCSKYVSIFSVRDNRLHAASQEFNLVRCKDCGLVYINPQPNSQQLSKFYPPDYYRPYSSLVYRSKIDLFFLLIADKQIQQLLKQVSRLNKGRKVLDVGCGVGLLLSRFQKEGYDIFGLDSNPDVLKALPKDIRNKVNIANLLDCSFQEASFDIVTLKQVLEHIPNPNTLLSEVCRILKPDGLLYIEAPSFLCWEAILFKKYCYSLEIPRHLYQYTTESLLNIARKNGLVPAAYVQTSVLDSFAEPLAAVRSFEYFLNDKKFLGKIPAKIIVLISSIPLIFLSLLLRVPYKRQIKIIFKKKREKSIVSFS